MVARVRYVRGDGEARAVSPAVSSSLYVLPVSRLGEESVFLTSLVDIAIATDGGADMKWVTRERPKTDRIACPWLIKNFIDPEAEFIYVPADEVLVVAQREGAHYFDAPNAEYT
jgi:hypothetical protein